MSRCLLGPKKHKKCEQITGKKYDRCLVRGGSTHFEAHCSYVDDNGVSKADIVNYKTGEFEPDTWLNSINSSGAMSLQFVKIYEAVSKIKEESQHIRGYEIADKISTEVDKLHKLWKQ